MITTKMIQNDYKKIFVVKNEQRNDFVPLLYRICSSVKNKIVSELQRIYYKTTKKRYVLQLFSPYSKIRGITKRRN
jgi:hypothetical protein